MTRIPYASTTDVVAKLSFVGPAGFTPSTRPNASQVHSFLVEKSNELDAHLGIANYTLPIATGATMSAELMRGWVSVGAACAAARAMPQGSDSKHQEMYCQEWSAILGNVDGGVLALPDVVKDSSTSLPRFPRSEGSASPYFNRQTLGDH